jgi:hypothetical protein
LELHPSKDTEAIEFDPGQQRVKRAPEYGHAEYDAVRIAECPNQKDKQPSPDPVADGEIPGIPPGFS